MESSAGGGGRAWWTVAEHFQAPLVFYVDAEQEELVFGREDSDLRRRIEEHSHTLIQLEAWATEVGQMRVTVVGPPGAQRWLWGLLCSLGNGEPGSQARGHTMLQRVRSRPLSWAELAAFGREQHQVGDMCCAQIVGLYDSKFNYSPSLCCV